MDHVHGVIVRISYTCWNWIIVMQPPDSTCSPPLSMVDWKSWILKWIRTLGIFWMLWPQLIPGSRLTPWYHSRLVGEFPSTSLNGSSNNTLYTGLHIGPNKGYKHTDSVHALLSMVFQCNVFSSIHTFVYTRQLSHLHGMIPSLT